MNYFKLVGTTPVVCTLQETFSGELYRKLESIELAKKDFKIEISLLFKQRGVTLKDPYFFTVSIHKIYDSHGSYKDNEYTNYKVAKNEYLSLINLYQNDLLIENQNDQRTYKGICLRK